jgi:RNA polymerase II-associated factor 1
MRAVSLYATTPCPGKFSVFDEKILQLIQTNNSTAIQAPLLNPPVHPKDRNLLRPLKNLGQPKTEVSGISFLRRTQYTASDLSVRHENTNRKLGAGNTKRRKPADVVRDEPISILRNVIKGFDIAHPDYAYKGPDGSENMRGAQATPAEIDAWNNPVHPSKPQLKAVDTFPLLPDFEAATDDGQYMVTKFHGQPTDVTDRHDPRMDACLIRALEIEDQIFSVYQEQQAAHEADPASYPEPIKPTFDYEFFLPPDEHTAQNYKRKIDLEDPDHDDPSLYTHRSSQITRENDCFRYDKIREYETGHYADNTAHPYQEVALVFWDPKGMGKSRLKKGAYVYPTGSRVQLKPRRTHIVGRADEREKIDVANVSVRDANEVEITARKGHGIGAGFGGE